MRLWQRELCATYDVLLADTVLLCAISPNYNLHLLQRCIAAPAAKEPPSLLHVIVHSLCIPMAQQASAMIMTTINGYAARYCRQWHIKRCRQVTESQHLPLLPCGNLAVGVHLAELHSEGLKVLWPIELLPDKIARWLCTGI